MVTSVWPLVTASLQGHYAARPGESDVSPAGRRGPKTSNGSASGRGSGSGAVSANASWITARAQRIRITAVSE